MRDLGHQPALDGLRGIAVAAVLWTHFSFLNGGSTSWSLPGGFLGVDVFLVLSGFLIGSVLLGELSRLGTIRGRRFAKRRAQRLVPPLLALLVIQAIVSFAFYPDLKEQALQFLLVITFTSNWQMAFGHSAPFELVHLWSLALEGQFYALSAVFLHAVRKRLSNPRVLVVALVVGSVAVAAWRYFLYRSGASTGDLYQRTDTRLDSLMLGTAVAIAWRCEILSVRVARTVGGAGGLLLLVAAATAHPSSGWLFAGGFTVISAAAASIVVASATGGGVVQRVGDNRALRWLGSISYSLYLWHLPIYIWTVRAFPEWLLWQKALLAVPASLAVASVSFRLIESRVLAPWRGGRDPAGLSPDRSLP